MKKFILQIFALSVLINFLNSCSEENPTKIVSERNIYEGKIDDSDLNSLINDATNEINEAVDELVSLENFPKDLVGNWADDCSALSSNQNGGIYAEVINFEIDSKGQISGGFQYETSAEIIDISGGSGKYLMTYTEKTWGDETKSQRTSNIVVSGNRLKIDGTTFYKCQ